MGLQLMGDWSTQTITMTILEVAGDVQAYNDFDNGGQSKINTNYEYRDNFLFQTTIQYGELQKARMDQTPISYIASLQKSRIRNLQVKQNNMYFYGINGLRNYGALNDPSLPAAVSPLQKSNNSISWEKATAMEIYEDIEYLYATLQKQNQGVVNLNEAVDMDSPLRLVVANNVQAYLLKTNQYGLSVLDLLKKNFPNLTQMSDPHFDFEAGSLVQLFMTGYDGNDTFKCTYSTKMKSFGLVKGASSYYEKSVQGGYGTILKYPTLVAQMIGV